MLLAQKDCKGRPRFSLRKNRILLVSANEREKKTTRLYLGSYGIVIDSHTNAIARIGEGLLLRHATHRAVHVRSDGRLHFTLEEKKCVARRSRLRDLRVVNFEGRFFAALDDFSQLVFGDDGCNEAGGHGNPILQPRT